MLENQGVWRRRWEGKVVSFAFEVPKLLGQHPRLTLLLPQELPGSTRARGSPRLWLGQWKPLQAV